MKKKSLILLLCLALVVTLAVNGTFAQELQNVVDSVVQYFRNVAGLEPPTTSADFQVKLVSSSSGVLTPAGSVDTEVCVQNAAKEDAYVRLCIAVKQSDKLTFQLANVDSAYSLTTATVTIAKEAFTLYTLDYKTALAAGASTPKIKLTAALDSSTTNEDIEALGSDFLRMQTFAIQASAFMQLDENGNKITAESTDKTPMSPLTALQTAMGAASIFNPFQ